jgi:mono/diheme cytochrome c family protein
MKRKKLSLLFAVSFLGLSLGACSQDQAESSAASDTAVHTAEVAVATADELMAKGEAVYNANCAACHQPNGQGLTGAERPGPDRGIPATGRFGLPQGRPETGHGSRPVRPVGTDHS